MTAADTTRGEGDAAPHRYDPEVRILDALLDDRMHHWTVEGPFDTGPDVVMLSGDDDLTLGTPWVDEGYCIVDCLGEQQTAQLRRGIARLIARDLADLGIAVPAEFDPQDYHRFADDTVHRSFTGRNNCFFPLEELPVPREILEGCVSETVGRPVVLLEVPGRPPSFLVRVVRPSSGDHSPPHRDVWLPHLRHTIAAYLPVAGSHARSSLPLVPRSHRWPEHELVRTRDNAVANGVRYGVPAVAASSTPLRLVRPDPAPGRMMIFSPYLVHGAGINLGDVTRVSLELRFRPASPTSGA